MGRLSKGMQMHSEAEVHIKKSKKLDHGGEKTFSEQPMLQISPLPTSSRNSFRSLLSYLPLPYRHIEGTQKSFRSQSAFGCSRPTSPPGFLVYAWGPGLKTQILTGICPGEVSL